MTHRYWFKNSLADFATELGKKSVGGMVGYFSSFEDYLASRVHLSFLLK